LAVKTRVPVDWVHTGRLLKAVKPTVAYRIRSSAAPSPRLSGVWLPVRPVIVSRESLGRSVLICSVALISVSESTAG